MESLEGTREAKERLRVALETIAGTRTIAEACEELGVKEATVHELRARALQAALRELEPKEMGRPRKEREENGKVEDLERQVAELRRRLTVAEVKADLHSAMPKLGERVKDSEKKTKGSP